MMKKIVVLAVLVGAVASFSVPTAVNAATTNMIRNTDTGSNSGGAGVPNLGALFKALSEGKNGED